MAKEKVQIILTNTVEDPTSGDHLVFEVPKGDTKEVRKIFDYFEVSNFKWLLAETTERPQA